MSRASSSGPNEFVSTPAAPFDVELCGGSIGIFINDLHHTGVKVRYVVRAEDAEVLAARLLYVCAQARARR